MKPCLLLGACAFAWALGCSPPKDTGDAATSSSACQDRAYANCNLVQACSPTALVIRYGTLANCQSLLNQSCVAALTAPSTGDTPAIAEACANTYTSDIMAIQSAVTKSTLCGNFLYDIDLPTECQAQPGSLSLGAACSANAQCQSAWCSFPVGAACGTCAPMPSAGSPCASNWPGSCPEGFYCASNNTCVNYAPVGTSCAVAPCQFSSVCVGGMCVMSADTLNGPCLFATGGCNFYDGLVCNAESATCVTAGLAQPRQACGIVDNQSVSCVMGDCVRGICVAWASLGGACDLNGVQCAADTRCIVTSDGSTTGTCMVSGSSVCN
jgi:hypothetical protein